MAYTSVPGGNRRKKKHTRRPPATPRVIFTRRLSLIVLCFCAICVVYTALLIAFGATGNAFSIFRRPELPTGATTKTVTIQAVRGEIYDRNGKPLVTNRSSYDLMLDHAPLMTTTSAERRNRALLSAVSLLRTEADGTLSEEYVPFEGVYPAFSYTEQAKDPNSTTATKLKILLARLELSSTASPGTLASYYVNKYALSATLDGIPAYTDEEITTLIKIYYRMDLCRFGTDTAEYTLIENASASVVAASLELGVTGLRVQMRSERVYHYPGYASHLLGRVNKIFAEDWEYYNAQGYPMNAIVGVSGCESAFEQILRGSDGQMKVTVDGTGKTVSSEILKEPIAGKDIRLTIDIDLQVLAEDTLRAQVGENGKGAVVVNDPTTGACLAIASAPSYDLRNFSENYNYLASDPLSPLLNRALSSVYAPGKLLSLGAAAAGLETGALQSSTMWYDTGTLTYNGGVVLCPLLYTQDTGHGYLGLSTALVDGCEVFLGQLGLRLGATKLSNYEAAFGLGQKTGLELSEGAGTTSTLLTDDQEQAVMATLGLSNARMTPAQMNAYLSTIISGGSRYRTYLLQEVRSYTGGDVISQAVPTVIGQVSLHDSTRTLLLRALRDIAEKDARLSPLQQTLSVSNVEFGALLTSSPASIGGTSNGLCVAYGRPILSTASSTKSITVSVVIEGAEPQAATPVIEAVFGSFYGIR